MIREATHDDIEGLVAMGAAMHGASPRFSRLVFVPAKLTTTLRWLVDCDDGFLYVAEVDGRCVGVMAGAAMEHWMSTDKVAADLALFVEPAARGAGAADALVLAFKAWARERGVTHPQAGCSAGIADEAAAAMYERHGFRRCGILLEAT